MEKTIIPDKEDISKMDNEMVTEKLEDFLKDPMTPDNEKKEESICTVIVRFRDSPQETITEKIEAAHVTQLISMKYEVDGLHKYSQYPGQIGSVLSRYQFKPKTTYYTEVICPLKYKLDY
jgi:hypothetical protein